eukprot:CAMPEP_0172831390 /NCGR_PEP_ID=MMETSP1075-20121228/22940_1 /TAXON_ID=2916 /ORGANISM="Ceratium fusus, Strain PA161109" /LENGTH=157 /DNA_ID=CAMNT_0013673853 /DNA_START=57 /DNA_END=526 /DNA_ORIENTATION=-
MQQRASAILAKIMKDMYLPALATLPVAWILAYVPHFTKVGVMLHLQGPSRYNNLTPRTTDPSKFGDAAALIKRCIGCHENSLESFPVFAIAVLACKMQKVKPPLAVARLCLRYLAMRVAYTAAYLSGSNNAVGALRTMAWAGSFHSVWQQQRGRCFA